MEGQSLQISANNAARKTVASLKEARELQDRVRRAAACTVLDFSRQWALDIFMGFRGRVVCNAILAHLIEKEKWEMFTRHICLSLP